jgi:acyl carrier protein
MTMTLPEFHAAVVGFFRDSGGAQLPADLDETSNLFDLGLLDSLRLAELVIFVEELLQRSIPLEDLDVRVFHTTAGMYGALV